MAHRVIDLLGAGLQKQAIASGAITPGMLVEFGEDGNGELTIAVHGTASGNAPKAFAIENELIGKGIDDAYADTETAQYMSFPSGAEVNAIASEQIDKGDFVESAGDGKVRVVDTEAATADTQRAGVVGVCKVGAAQDGDRVIIEII